MMGMQMQGGMRFRDGVELSVDGLTFRASAYPSVEDDDRVVVRVSQVDCDPSFAWHQIGGACVFGLTWEQAADAVADAAMAIAEELAATITAKPAAPSCSGSLATHEKPVLRHRGSLLGGTSLVHMCDPCYLFAEKLLADDEAAISRDRAPGLSAWMPAARIGTVPQVVSPFVGILGARGMR
jgi:hypothetical protein